MGEFLHSKFPKMRCICGMSQAETDFEHQFFVQKTERYQLFLAVVRFLLHKSHHLRLKRSILLNIYLNWSKFEISFLGFQLFSILFNVKFLYLPLGTE